MCHQCAELNNLYDTSVPYNSIHKTTFFGGKSVTVRQLNTLCKSGASAEVPICVYTLLESRNKKFNNFFRFYIIQIGELQY
jgi:hypothetical protein